MQPNGTAIGCVNPPVGGQAVTWLSSRVSASRRIPPSMKACPPTGEERHGGQARGTCPDGVERNRGCSFCLSPANLAIVICAVICPEPEVMLVFLGVGRLFVIVQQS